MMTLLRGSVFGGPSYYNKSLRKGRRVFLRASVNYLQNQDFRIDISGAYGALYVRPPMRLVSRGTVNLEYISRILVTLTMQ